MKKLNQQGAVSFLSVVIFATIITVLVTAYVSSALSQQRSSVRYDHSTRAYYAAETGIQDAVRAVRLNLTLADNEKSKCKPLYAGSAATTNDTLRTNLNLDYTCQLIDPTPDQIPVTLEQDQNTLMRLNVNTPVAGNYKLVLRWSEKTEAGDAFSKRIPREVGRYFTPESGWSDGDTAYHSVLRATVINAPLNGNATLLQNVTFLNPAQAGAGTGNGALAKPADATTVQDATTLVQNASCVDSDSATSYSAGGDSATYSCQQEILLSGYDFTTDAVYLRLRPLYGSPEVEISLTKDDVVAEQKDVALELDVTGRSGTVYRRIKQTVSLDNSIQTDRLPEAAVIGTEGICKLYKIGAQASQFVNQCPEYN